MGLLSKAILSPTAVSPKANSHCEKPQGPACYSSECSRNPPRCCLFLPRHTQVVQARVTFLQSLTVNAQPIYFSSLAVPHGMWDLAPGPGRVPMLNHWTTRDVPAIYLFLKILNFCKNLLHTGLLKMRYPVTKPRVRFHLKQSDNGSKLGVLKPQASPWVYDTCLCQ